jgi:hypothetical protein
MLPEARLKRGAPGLVLYWEYYNVRPSDSASTSVRIASDQTISRLRRLGMMAGVASDPSSSIEIQWKDREGRGGTTTLQGPVPVQMRTIQLDLRALKPGRYVVEISVRLADGSTASQQTTVVIDP